ncbi:hypothetical protein BASA81_000864 [Batrachochytrium salamandrivorans]|nr:hypothetical protein BASA81_000864 [Batrachochytrium salamandrivorans]
MSDRLAKLAAKAEQRSKILAGEAPSPPPAAAATASAPENTVAAVPESAEKKKLDREARLLAKAELRMKVVNGEVKLDPPKEDEIASDKVAATDVDSTVKDNRGRWERRWEETSAQSEVREVSPEFLSKLDVTAEMAVEAPKSQVSAEEELAAIRKINQKLGLGQQKKWEVDLGAVLTSLVLVGLGLASGWSNGLLVENIWLPLGSLVGFALVLRLVTVTSLQRLGLGRPARQQQQQEEGNWMVKMALQFLPPPLSGLLATGMNAVGYVKDSNDDMLLFVFVHGVTYNCIQYWFQSAVKLQAGEQDGEFNLAL